MRIWEVEALLEQFRFIGASIAVFSTIDLRMVGLLSVVLLLLHWFFLASVPVVVRGI